jgi:hypothetical protein
MGSADDAARAAVDARTSRRVVVMVADVEIIRPFWVDEGDASFAFCGPYNLVVRADDNDKLFGWLSQTDDLMGESGTVEGEMVKAKRAAVTATRRMLAGFLAELPE